MARIDGGSCRIYDEVQDSRVLRDAGYKTDHKLEFSTVEMHQEVAGLRRSINESKFAKHRTGRDFPRRPTGGVDKDHFCRGLEERRAKSFDVEEIDSSQHCLYREMYKSEVGKDGLFQADDRRRVSDQRYINGHDFYKFKANFPSFSGNRHTNHVLDWIDAVDDHFDETNTPEALKYELAAAKLKGQARTWWKTLQNHRLSEGKDSISSWFEMSEHLFFRFLPSNCSIKCPSSSYSSSQAKNDENSSPGEGSVEEQSKEIVEAKPANCSKKVRCEPHIIKHEAESMPHGLKLLDLVAVSEDGKMAEQTPGKVTDSTSVEEHREEVPVFRLPKVIGHRVDDVMKAKRDMYKDQTVKLKLVQKMTSLISRQLHIGAVVLPHLFKVVEDVTTTHVADYVVAGTEALGMVNFGVKITNVPDYCRNSISLTYGENLLMNFDPGGKWRSQLNKDVEQRLLDFVTFYIDSSQLWSFKFLCHKSWTGVRRSMALELTRSIEGTKSMTVSKGDHDLLIDLNDAVVQVYVIAPDVSHMLGLKPIIYIEIPGPEQVKLLIIKVDTCINSRARNFISPLSFESVMEKLALNLVLENVMWPCVARSVCRFVPSTVDAYLTPFIKEFLYGFLFKINDKSGYPTAIANSLSLQGHVVPHLVDDVRPQSLQRCLYYIEPLLNFILLVILSMAKPEDILIIGDENGIVDRETIEHIEVLVLYHIMVETLVCLPHKAHDATENRILKKLSKQLNGENWMFSKLVSLSWNFDMVLIDKVVERGTLCVKEALDSLASCMEVVYESCVPVPNRMRIKNSYLGLYNGAEIWPALALHLYVNVKLSTSWNGLCKLCFILFGSKSIHNFFVYYEKSPEEPLACTLFLSWLVFDSRGDQVLERLIEGCIQSLSSKLVVSTCITVASGWKKMIQPLCEKRAEIWHWMFLHEADWFDILVTERPSKSCDTTYLSPAHGCEIDMNVVLCIEFISMLFKEREAGRAHIPLTNALCIFGCHDEVLEGYWQCSLQTDTSLTLARGRANQWEGRNDEKNVIRHNRRLYENNAVMEWGKNEESRETLKLFHKVVNGLDPPNDARMSRGSLMWNLTGSLEDKLYSILGRWTDAEAIIYIYIFSIKKLFILVFIVLKLKGNPGILW